MNNHLQGEGSIVNKINGIKCLFDEILDNSPLERAQNGPFGSVMQDYEAKTRRNRIAMENTGNLDEAYCCPQCGTFNARGTCRCVLPEYL